MCSVTSVYEMQKQIAFACCVSVVEVLVLIQYSDQT